MENLKISDELFVPATKEEREGIQVMREPSSYWKDVYKRFCKNKVAVVSFWFIVVVILVSIIGPYISPYRYDQQIKGSEFIRPFVNWSHPLGTDNFGRDVFVRLMMGARISLAIGIVASLMILVIGVIYGAISGYFGGWVDNIMMRIVEIISSIPSLLIIILLSVVISPNLRAYLDAHPNNTFLKTIGGSLLCIFITFALLYWTDMARMVRGQILSVKNEEYVAAAKALGAKPGRIIRKHLLPNSMGVIIVTATLNIPTAIFTEAYLSFLGLGVSAPMCSLGSLASDALSGIYSYSYLLICPSILISLIILAFYLIGDALRNALDPRMKK
ncbi:ABC-type transporter, integral membrane subunit [[Clostridium] cellulosi]|jgi:Binding-protein-dependent transport system inner membrane component.|uniref:ABC-type transporter, integral membrane subunit n=1 Tax=[Clostridium] cellulosi TaxID=29343 RepID=A0A078KPC1_9FIRM|nr:ABC-type transporter, integral membrane subunit [[Clostridium] cellulosi]